MYYVSCPKGYYHYKEYADAAKKWWELVLSGIHRYVIMYSEADPNKDILRWEIEAGIPRVKLVFGE